MKTPIRTAVIGAGNMGKHHARLYHELTTLAAIVDVNPAMGEPVAHQYNVPYYHDLNQMIQTEHPDAVSVVVPTIYHSDVTIACLKSHIPTLVEKPIAATVPEAEQMLKVAQQTQTFLMVGHVERFNPAVIHLKELIDRGVFGKIVSLLALRVGIIPPRSKNSDVAVDLAIHDVDVFAYLLNKIPLSATVKKRKVNSQNIADVTSILVEFPGVTGVIQANWITPIKIRKLYVTGTKRFAELDYIEQQLVMLEKVTPRESADFFELTELSKIPTKETFLSKKEPLKEELKYFLKHRHDTQWDETYKALEALRVVI